MRSKLYGWCSWPEVRFEEITYTLADMDANAVSGCPSAQTVWDNGTAVNQ
jgi:hypothetical protein